MCAADACVCRAQGLLQAFEQTCGKAPEELLSNPFQAQLLGQSSNSVQRRMNKLTERWVPGGGGGGGVGVSGGGGDGHCQGRSWWELERVSGVWLDVEEAFIRRITA
jgi:hypothetical protein